MIRSRTRFPLGALLLATLLGAPPPGMATGDEPGEHASDETLRMAPAERERRGIRTATVQARLLAEAVRAPGEVRLDAYRTARVTPRISAQVVARHARLGQRVRPGQPLVTLSSVVMADAQGRLIEAEREWQRVRRLGREVVSDKRYVAAQVARQQAHATVSAYGMTDRQIRALLKGTDPARANGNFDLLSPLEGSVIADDFVLGEFIEPGRMLFEISDERRLWVEARVDPALAPRIAADAVARIDTGAGWIEGRVVQRHKRVDPRTRTLALRIAIDNAADRLHPGQFVEVELAAGEPHPRLAVPTGAVVMLLGAPTVFTVQGDRLTPRPVETAPARGGWVPVVAGLAEGETVVVQGAFLLKSLLLRSRMGEDSH